MIRDTMARSFRGGDGKTRDWLGHFTVAWLLAHGFGGEVSIEQCIIVLSSLGERGQEDGSENRDSRCIFTMNCHGYEVCRVRGILLQLCSAPLLLPPLS